MSELDILNLALSCGQAISTYFAQVIAITFAMVVAIYYFLHQAGIRMKVFAFIIYTFGMFTYLGLMLIASGVAIGASQSAARDPSRIAIGCDAVLSRAARELGWPYLQHIT